MWDAKTLYGLAADATVGVHVMYVAYVMLGLALIVVGWACGWKWVKNPWFRLTHLLAIAIVVYEELMNIRCPLTVWEEKLRVLAGQPVTGESFMGRCLHSILFYDAPPWVFTVGYLSFGSLVFATFLFFPPRMWRFRERTTLVHG
jgi:hypothetical protein